MIVHWPLASVTVVVQVPPVIEPIPVSVPLTVTPAAATQPPPRPRFFSTVTVKVCGSPTLFVPDVPIVIRASTHVLTLLTMFAPKPSVATVIGTPFTEIDAEALTVLWPTRLELTMIVHWPLASVSAPTPSQVPPVIDPTPVSDGVTVAPATPANPDPLSASTVTVKVCGSPTLFVPDDWMLIRAFTQVLTFEMSWAP